MAPAKATTTTAVKLAFLAAVFVLCLAGLGSCQSAGFDCTDGNYLALTDICLEADCAPGEFLDPFKRVLNFNFGIPSDADFVTFTGFFDDYCVDREPFPYTNGFSRTFNNFEEVGSILPSFCFAFR